MILLLAWLSAHAHERLPAHLAASPTDHGWQVELRTPVVARRPLDLQLVFPEDCTQTRHEQTLGQRALVHAHEVRCDSLRGLTVSGLHHTQTDVWVEIDGHPPAVLHAASPTWTPSAPGWVLRGVHHILAGADHVLFLVGLLLAVPHVRGLLWTVSAFTVAHSLSLGLGALGLIPFSAAAVEVLIALSLLLLAAELTRRPSIEHPERFAAAAGLLHGLGFAGALSLLELSTPQFLDALWRFNLGVELGQLAIVGVSWLLLRTLSERARPPLLVLLGGMATFWLADRLVAWW